MAAIAGRALCLSLLVVAVLLIALVPNATSVAPIRGHGGDVRASLPPLREEAFVEDPEEESAFVFRDDPLTAGARPLGFLLRSANQTTVALNFFHRASASSSGDRLGCHGPPCPSFGSCAASGFPDVQACWNPSLVDEPREAATTTADAAAAAVDEASPPLALQVFRLRDVYVTHGGFAFNATHQFARGGCQPVDEFAFGPAKRVRHVASAFNWQAAQVSSFQHFVTEAVPALYVAAKTLPSIRGTPFLATAAQWRHLDRAADALIGIPKAAMSPIAAMPGDLFFAKTVYQPSLQACSAPSHALWTSLRRHHLLHPQGLPLFNPDWTLRTSALSPLTDAQMAAVPSDWLVVLYNHRLDRRSLSNFEELERLVLEYFPRERVVRFNGAGSIEDARDLFRRTRLFISGHGSALTNAIFMPSQAAVVEVRAQGCAAPTCYASLSAACSVRHHVVDGLGDCQSRPAVNMKQASVVIKDIARGFAFVDQDKELVVTV